MYSGTTLTPLSGRILGAHQKFDRLARTNLGRLLDEKTYFPAIRRILHFEGVRGPDAIKRKSPAKDEPWHYIAPFDNKDKTLTNLIADHYKQLVAALKKHDEVRAAFEAAWLAHALVDGLTPAHHYPYEEELVELRGGEGIETRTTVRQKIVQPGDTKRQQVRNNWKMWGPKGLLITHGFFEFGIAAMVAPLSARRVVVTHSDLEEFEKLGIAEAFRRKVQEVGHLDMYERYYKHGWTPRLAQQARHHLVPVIVKLVTCAWYAAAKEANEVKA